MGVVNQFAPVVCVTGVIVLVGGGDSGDLPGVVIFARTKVFTLPFSSPFLLRLFVLSGIENSFLNDMAHVDLLAFALVWMLSTAVS